MDSPFKPEEERFSWQIVLIKLSSRKFLALLTALLTALAGVASHQIDFAQFLLAVVAAIAVYQASEAVADLNKRP